LSRFFIREESVAMIDTAETAPRIRYFKRYKMEVDLAGLPPVETPPGYQWMAWHGALLDTHADVLWQSFCHELDSEVFPSLGDRAGCSCLLTEISRKSGFLPGATWLLVDPANLPCASVQGIQDRGGVGAIQNIGVLPSHRGRGLGQAVLLQALHGFWGAGLGRAWLEVTAGNDGAIRLYRRLGFRSRKTIYKAVPDIRFL
jgi:ribosomal protein S18 acetylase RimI-like enzyme